MDKTSIGNRMKAYERVTKAKLMRRTPVIIRLDGKAFHTWTNCLTRLDASLVNSPFSDMMHDCMSSTANELVGRIQNATISYTQSDEISILLNDWKSLKTEQWFDGNIQKIVSISASMATAYFNDSMQRHTFNTDIDNRDIPLAFFDSRVFNIPKEEVANYFVWRQQDATRNSINMLGQFYFSHKELQGKNTNQVQDMLMMSLGHGGPLNINWNDLDIWKKRGYCATRDYMDDAIPIFTQDREYIERHLTVNNDD